MNDQLVRRFLPRKRRWWLLAALLTTLFVVVSAGFCFPQVQELAAATLGAIRQLHAAGDGHDRAMKMADDGHGHAQPLSGGDAHSEAGHASEAAGGHGSEEPGHEEPGHSETEATAHQHDEAATVKLSAAAQENVGLRLAMQRHTPLIYFYGLDGRP